MPDITSNDLHGRTIRIDAQQRVEALFCRVTFADTGEEITNIERIQIDIQVKKDITATLHLVYRGQEEQVITPNVELSTFAAPREGKIE